MSSVLHRLASNLHVAVVPLRIALALTFAMLVVFQVLSLPGQFVNDARDAGEDAHLYWVLLAVSELLVLCAQVVIACVWQLLTLVREDRIFTERAFAWVDRSIWAMATGCAVLLAGFAYLAASFRDPALPLMMILLLLVGAVVALLMVVMRALLWQATTLRTDMDAVI